MSMHPSMKYLALVLTLAPGCVGFPWDRPLLASGIVGSEGGRIEGDGIVLEIPAGALSDDVEVSISISNTAVDDSYVPLSPVYRFDPEGLEFASPVQVT